MEQFLEFIGNHWILSSLWLAALAAIIVYHQRSGSKALSTAEAVTLINRKDALVLDVREKKEFDAGHVVDAINIPLAKLKQRMPELNKHKEKPVLVVCKLGQHSGDATRQLQEAGFTEVYKLSGGVGEWKAQSLPLVTK